MTSYDLGCSEWRSRQLIEQRLSPLLIERIKAVGEPAVDRREKIAGLHGYSLNDGWATTPTRIRLSGAKKWQAAHLACHKMITGELAPARLIPSVATLAGNPDQIGL